MIPWLAVFDCQTRELVDPLTSRRLPSERKERVAVESVTAESPPAFQMGMPLKVMAAKKVFCWEMKENEKVLLGDDQFRVVFAAESD